LCCNVLDLTAIAIAINIHDVGVSTAAE
jgi:hypothetical protein